MQHDQDDLKRIFETHLPATYQDQIVIFVSATGRSAAATPRASTPGRLPTRRSTGRTGAGSRSRRRPGVCGVLDLLMDGELPQQGSSGRSRSTTASSSPTDSASTTRRRARFRPSAREPGKPVRTEAWDRVPDASGLDYNPLHAGRSVRPPAMNALRALGPAVLLPAALAAQTPPLQFTDVTVASGLTWVQQDNNTMMGAGGAFLDYDRDGRLDVLLAGGPLGAGAVPQRRRHELRRGAAARVRQLAVDVDLHVYDGRRHRQRRRPGRVLRRWGPNRLLRNDGGTSPRSRPRCSPGSASSRPPQRSGTTTRTATSISTSATTSSGSTTRTTRRRPTRMFRGHGDGAFSNATDGLLAGAGTALATTWTDYDDDGDADLFVGNDFGAFIEPNQVLRNDGTGPSGHEFRRSARRSRRAADLLHGHRDRRHRPRPRLRLLLHEPRAQRPAAQRRHVVRRHHDPVGDRAHARPDDAAAAPARETSWGCGFHDFDCDGWVDLYVSNGHIPGRSRDRERPAHAEHALPPRRCVADVQRNARPVRHRRRPRLRLRRLRR